MSLDLKLLNLKKRYHFLFLSLLLFAVTLPGLASLQVIDRDEARFAQASVQMAESNDLLNIRFQNDARNKKPAGIYWLQVGAIKLLSTPRKRQIWVQRIPSVLGALLAVLATYWGGAKLIGRQSAFLAGAALALSFLLIFEAHIAKTDAVLCGLSASCFAALATLRSFPKARSLWKPRPAVWVFWLAFGAAILVKGPVVPSLLALTVLTLLIWDKGRSGLGELINIPAIIAAILLFVPWAIAIGIETQGAFFTESLGNDFAGKLVSAQESHPGPPGYYFALLNITLWPGSLLLFPSIMLTFQNLRQPPRNDHILSHSLRLCVAWIIPFLILIELMPTKLPHYVLPIFPALFVLIGWTGTTLLKVVTLTKTRLLGAFIFMIVGSCLVTVVLLGQKNYASQSMGFTPNVMMLICLILIVSGGVFFGLNKIKLSFITAGLAGLILNITTYSAVLPNLDRLKLADRLVDSFRQNKIALPREGGPVVQSLNFTEPSFVYQFGKEVRLGDQVDLSNAASWTTGTIFIVDDIEDNGAVLENLQLSGKIRKSCLAERDVVSGFNYSRGDEVNLHVLEVIPCSVK